MQAGTSTAGGAHAGAMTPGLLPCGPCGPGGMNAFMAMPSPVMGPGGDPLAGFAAAFMGGFIMPARPMAPPQLLGTHVHA